MSQPERQGGEFYPRRERKTDLLPYHAAARFADEHAAGNAYVQAQEAIFAGPPNDVSSFRLLLNGDWHVSVLGQVPPDDLAEQLSAILAAGEPTELPAEVLTALAARRRKMLPPGTLWREGHYRPPHQR